MIDEVQRKNSVEIGCTNLFSCKFVTHIHTRTHIHVYYIYVHTSSVIFFCVTVQMYMSS